MKNAASQIILAVALYIFFAMPSLLSQEASINWMSWEEAMEANNENPKKLFVDVYTDWCGYCKKMDATTFKEEKLINLLNENFYAIKFNAEQKEEITHNDFTYKYVKGNRKGYHQLAQTLLDGRMGYPSFVLLDEEKTRIMLSPGYKVADKVIVELQYALQEKYKEQSFSQFRKSYRQ